jgi:hypothetical protein
MTAPGERVRADVLLLAFAGSLSGESTFGRLARRVIRSAVEQRQAQQARKPTRTDASSRLDGGRVTPHPPHSAGENHARTGFDHR